MRADMAKMSDNMRTLATEMTAMRQHMAGFSTIQDHDLLYGIKRVGQVHRDSQLHKIVTIVCYCWQITEEIWLTYQNHMQN